MNGAKVDQKRRLVAAQIVAALWSVFFVGVIFYGYFLLLQNSPVLAIIAATLLSVVAWLFARLIGESDTGIRGHLPLFVALLLISAVGVANFMFLNFEGRRIFTETAEEAQDNFGLLAGRARQKLATDGYFEKRERVDRLTDALIREINNPLNCGQGPKANDIMQELASLLPDFRPLSGNVNCARNTAVVTSYKDRIRDLADKAPWNNPELKDVVLAANANKVRLQELGNTASGATAYTLLTTVLPPLKDIDLAYRTSYEKLSAQNGDTADVPKSLNLDAVQSLGEATQLLGLITNRLDRPATYVYIAIAFGFDWFMIYLFGLLRRSRAGKGGIAPQSMTNQKAW